MPGLKLGKEAQAKVTQFVNTFLNAFKILFFSLNNNDVNRRIV